MASQPFSPPAAARRVSHVDLTVPARSKWAEVPVKKLTSADRVERNRSLVALKIRRPDLTWVDLAVVFGVTDRQARNIWAEWRDSDRDALTAEEPVDVIHEHIAGFRDLRAQAAVLAETTVRDEITLGALKLVAALRAKDIELRQQTGLLPHDLGRIEVELDMRFIVERVVDLLRRHQVPKDEIAELISVLDGEVTPQTILSSAKAPTD